jgi:hypothetical protein
VGGLAGAVQLSRRDLLRRAALAAGTVGAPGLLAACGAGPGGQAQQPAAAGSLRALVDNVQQLSLLNAQRQLPAGRSRFAFGLSAENNRLVEGVAPQIWIAKDQTSKALGPYPARWLQMTGYDKTRDRSPRSDLTGSYGKVDIRSARRAFAETTRLVAPAYDNLDSLSLNRQLIFHTLVSEQLSPVGIVIGYHGYATEKAFRDSLLTHLEEQLNTAGYGPGSFPQSMISGRFSLGKANGQPYSARMHGEWWPFYFSSRVNPVLLLLEYVWTRLDLEFHIGGFWGEDLTLEKMSPFLLARGVEVGGRTGWRQEWVDLEEHELAATDELEPWNPEFLPTEEFVIIQRLCDGHRVFFDDADLLRYLAEQRVGPEELKARLLDTGLVAMAGNQMELITDRCQPAILPDGRFAAGEDNTGRMTRWIARYVEERGSTPSP